MKKFNIGQTNRIQYMDCFSIYSYSLFDICMNSTCIYYVNCGRSRLLCVCVLNGSFLYQKMGGIFLNGHKTIF
jgi:hypothetical protein